MIAAVGLADDWYNLRARYKLLGQVAAILVLVLPGGFLIERVSVFGAAVELGSLAVPCTVLWLLACVNALNLIDGMDGLCGGLGIVARVQLPQQSGLRQAACAEIEDEIHQRVELALGQRHAHQMLHLLPGQCHVVLQQRRGLVLAHSIGKALAQQNPMPVANGFEPCHVAVDAAAKSLRLHQQFHSLGAQVHGDFLSRQALPAHWNSR